MHGIYDPHEDVFIPFKMHGCISYFASRLPTDEELASCQAHCTSRRSKSGILILLPLHRRKKHMLKVLSASSGEHFSADGNRSVFATSSHDRRTTVMRLLWPVDGGPVCPPPVKPCKLLRPGRCVSTRRMSSLGVSERAKLSFVSRTYAPNCTRIRSSVRRSLSEATSARSCFVTMKGGPQSSR